MDDSQSDRLEILDVQVLEGQWWVAHTRPRCEKVLAAQLHELQIGHYLPLVDRTTHSRRTRRVSQSRLPLFPGYVFVLANEETRIQALRTDRIVSILPVPRQSQLVAELRQIDHLIRTTGDVRRHTQLQKGDWVRVVLGSLEGVEGIVCKRLSRWRLAVNVNMLGQSVSVDVDEGQLESIDPPPYAR